MMVRVMISVRLSVMMLCCFNVGVWYDGVMSCALAVMLIG